MAAFRCSTPVSPVMANGTISPRTRQTSKTRPGTRARGDAPPSDGVQKRMPRYLHTRMLSIPRIRENDTMFRNMARSWMFRDTNPSMYPYIRLYMTM